MRDRCSFQSVLEKFPGRGGWVYATVPKKYTAELKARRRVWGRYPIIAHVGKTQWKTKLMVKKVGDFFVAFKAEIRDKEALKVGDRVKIFLKLNL